MPFACASVIGDLHIHQGYPIQSKALRSELQEVSKCIMAHNRKREESIKCAQYAPHNMKSHLECLLMMFVIYLGTLENYLYLEMIKHE